MQQTSGGTGASQRDQQRAEELQDQQQRTNERIRSQIEQAKKSLERQAEIVEKARQERQQKDDRARQQQAATRGSNSANDQGAGRLVIRNADAENTLQKAQGQIEQRERDPRTELRGQPEPTSMPLEDAASYALRRDEEHLDRQEQLGSMIDESRDPVERERLTLVKDAEHHAYASDQIDRILDIQTRLDRVAGTNISSSPEFDRLRERGTEHRAELGETMQALERHNAQHPPNHRPTASTRADNSAPRRSAAISPDIQSATSPRPTFSERASARRTAAEAQGVTMPPREHNTPSTSPSAAHAPALHSDETRGRSR